MIECAIYFLVFAIVFSLNSAAIKQKSIFRKRVLITTGFLILLGFIGLRFNVGTDYQNYIRDYNAISRISWEGLPALRMELLVAALFKILSYILWDPRLIFVVLGFLALYPVYRANKLYEYKYLAYSVLIYCVLFLPFSLNGARQGVAMSFILLSMTYLMREKKTFGIVCLVLACLFHTSALIVAPYLLLLLIKKIKKNKLSKLYIVLTATISFAVLFFLNDWLMNNGVDRYSYMLGNIETDKIALSGNVILHLAILPVMLLSEKNETNNIYKSMVMSGIIFMVIGTATQYLSRFSLYFLMPSIILIPRSIQYVKRDKLRLLVKVLLFAYLIAFFYLQYSKWGTHEILPYQTWVFGDM